MAIAAELLKAVRRERSSFRNPWGLFTEST
jgi:hypothetical protein